MATRLKRALEFTFFNEVDLLLIENPIDIFYLTGISLSVGSLAISPKGSSLFVDGRYLEVAQKQRKDFEVQLVEKVSSFLASFSRIGFDSVFTTFDRYQKLSSCGLSLKGYASPLKHLRMTKEAGEIQALTDAAYVTVQGYQHALTHLKEGVTEEAVAWEFESFCRRHGASCLSFPPIIAFGANSALPHHRAGKTRLTPDTVVLLDVGAVVNGYAGDFTRVHFFGKPNQQLQNDYELIRRLQKKAVAALVPGVPFKTIDDLVRSEMKQHGCEHLFIHGLSHGIGLETHEAPTLRKTEGDRDLILEEGMTLAVEPGLYRPGLGGVRYEDVVVVTKEGGKVLYDESSSPHRP